MIVHIINMNLDVSLDLKNLRPCKATIRKYTSGPKKGQYGTCKKMICMAEINPGKRDWQPFTQDEDGNWINHFDDCIDAVLFPKDYKNYINKYRPKQKPLSLFDELKT